MVRGFFFLAAILGFSCFQSFQALANPPEVSKRLYSLFQQVDSVVYFNPQLALDYAEEAVKVAREAHNDSLLAEALYRKGSAHWSKGDLGLAFTELNSSLDLSLTLDIPLLIANNYKRFGTLYNAIGDELSAIDYYRKAHESYVAVGDSTGILACYNNIGLGFSRLNAYDSSVFYLNKALDHTYKGFEFGRPIVYFNLGELYYRMGHDAKAMKYLQAARDFSERKGSRRGIIRTKQILAEIELRKGNLSEAHSLGSEAFILAQETQGKELLFFTSRTYSNIMFARGEYESGHQLQKMSEAYEDSINFAETRNRLDLFNTEQTRRELDQLRAQNAVDQMQSKYKNLILITISMIALLAIVLSVVFYRSQQLKTKANILLSEKNQRIEKQSVEINKLAEFKSKFMAIISHDIKSPIQGLFNVVDLIDRELASPEEINTLLPSIKGKIKRNYQKIDELLVWSSKAKNEYMNKEPFSIVDYVSLVVADVEPEIDLKQLHLECNLDPDILGLGDAKIFQMVFRNLLSNAIKYSDVGKKIEITGKIDKDHLQLTVKDTGIGMSESQVSDLFQFKSDPKEGTNGELGSGMGMLICKDLLNMMEGAIRVNSTLGVGSEFTLTMPAFVEEKVLG